MKKYCFIAITMLVSFSCTNGNHPPGSTEDSTEKKRDSFFPVTSFIRGQILILDSLPVTPLQLTTVKGKTDSVWLTKGAMRPLLLSFLTPAINETNLTSYFKETSFKDQTINAVTFTYDPVNLLPDSITLRHWDVYINPETGNVTRIYIVKEMKEHNQLFTQQLTWNTNKMAKISTILQKPEGKMELLKEVVFLWNFAP